MILQKKPITPSLRHTLLIQKNKLDIFFFKKKKKLLYNSNGKNNQGKITVRYRGGGHKQLYRFINLNRELYPIYGYVKTIIYDPYRSANLAGILIQYNPYLYTIEYILAPQGLIKNSYIESSKFAKILLGNALPLKNIPIGTLIHNLTDKKKTNGKFIRSAGTYGQLIQKLDQNSVRIRLKSGLLRTFPSNCFATIGIISNSEKKLEKIGKAGRNRWLNIRPHVRGVAKNPVDHPHGGGEGKTSGGRPSVTPKGRITKGKPTRKKK